MLIDSSTLTQSTEQEDLYDDIEVDVLTKDDVKIFIRNALDQAGHTWPELQKQAEQGCFTQKQLGVLGLSFHHLSDQREDLKQQVRKFACLIYSMELSLTASACVFQWIQQTMLS
ncbi:MAG: hypothetical protein OXI96_03675 [Acidimicrobiaceae bacterium]|nr:hypothetical protein [Acidimicrobiaceae bacterium]